MVSKLVQWREWRGCVFAAIALLAGSVSSALAEPSSKIGTAILVSPSAADSFYGSATTATNSIGSSARPNEIKELVRALKGDPDLIYEHVRNNTEMVWTYGLSKGALGVIVDRSGAAFDQAHLMVELLREAGFTASYKVGTITLTGTQFSDWSGITSATAACQLLSSGGIPAVINGSTTANCAYGSATVSSIEVGHVWVATTIASVEYVFDPAYKPHTFKAGLNLTTAAGMTTGEALTQASTSTTDGTASGVSYTQYVNASALNTKLTAYATALQTTLQATTPTPSMSDVVGGQAITPATIPSAGLRLISLPYTSSVLRTISGDVPNQYRTGLTVQITKVRPDTSTPTIVNKALYVDEIYSRRLIFDTNFDTTGASFTGALKLLDENGAGPSLASATYSDSPDFSKGTITLTVNAPYASGANGSSTVDGSYMDAVIARPVNYALPFTVVHGWGDMGRGLIDKWGSRKDTLMPAAPTYACAVCNKSYKVTFKGDGRRELLAASWLAQESKAASLHAAIAKSIITQHYAVGISAADTYVLKTDVNAGVGSPNYAYWITDSYDRLDVETGFSLTSKAATATDRRAGVQAIAATISALKGGVTAQVADLPDVNSTATRFEWANSPVADDTASAGSARRFYRYVSSGDAAQAAGLTQAEGVTTTSESGTHGITTPVLGNTELQARRQVLSDAISAYVAAGFSVVASEEAFLGPGRRAGALRVAGGSYTHEQSLQRGGALVATKYDGNGDPTEIAHILTGPNGRVDGGGGGAQTFHQHLYDPATSADVVKSRFIDGQPGDVNFTSPAKIVKGSGAAPFELSLALTWRGGDAKDETFGPIDHRQPQGPWTSSWNNGLTLSGSGLEAMGQTDVRAALGTIAAFVAAQDIYKASPALKRDVAGVLAVAWWTKQLNNNVATASLGAGTRQFVRKFDGQWLAPGAASYATLTQTGSRAIDVDHPSCSGSGAPEYMPTRGWTNSGLSFALKNGAGDTQTFSSWRLTFDHSAAGCVKQQGYRLSTWAWPTGATVDLQYSSSTGATSVQVPINVSSGYSTAQLTAGGLGGFTMAGYVAVAQQTGATHTHTDPSGAVTKFEIATIGTGAYQRFRLEKVYGADNATTPAIQYVFDTLARAKEVKDRLAVMGSRPSTQLLLANGLRDESIDALGYSTVVYRDLEGRPIRTINALGAVATAAYDGRGRPLSATSPEGQVTSVEYNDRNQPTKSILAARPGSAEAGQTITTETGWDATWNQPAWGKDPKGAQTDYSYNSYGALSSVVHPAAESGMSRYSGSLYYYGNGMPMSVTNPIGGTYSAAYDGSGGADWTARQSDTWDVLATTALGDPTSVQSPRGGISRFTYDTMRRRTWASEPSPVNSGSGSARERVATRTTYDVVGRATKVERGMQTNVTSQLDAGGPFVPYLTATTEYDVVGNVVKVVSPSGVTQYAYDALNRVTCTAVRMNPAVYGRLPSDACVPSTAGVNGPDRISRKVYDAIGQLVQEEIGVGSAAQQSAARYAYSPNRQKITLSDANGNASSLAYDGFGRVKRLYYPASPRGSGVPSTTDYEEYGYDVNGNRTSYRKRDGRVISYQYDALNRVIVKDLPSTTSEDVYYKYDGAGHLTQGRFGSASSDPAIRFSYDALGRVTSEKSYVSGTQHEVTSSYDADGNRIVVQPDSSSKTKYTYDLADRLTGVTINDWANNGLYVNLGAIAYGPMNRRSSMIRGNGTRADYSFDNVGRLSGLSQSGSSASTAFSQTFDYSPTGQVTGQAQSGAAYVWSGQPTTTTNFTHDQLNRDAAIAAASGYDANGNLTFDGVRTFTYDVENRLTAVTGGSAPVAVAYDPIGRIQKVTAGSATTDFQYDGQRLIAEYNAATNTRLRWYVHGVGVDDPIGWLEGEYWADPRWLHTDRQGSVIATSDSAGTVTPYTYGPYGEPQTWAGSRFRYTGQIALPEAQLYHYKARVYDPMKGRFLQTDPIGYGDGMNIYRYVHGDPMNGTDSSGLAPDWDGPYLPNPPPPIQELEITGNLFPQGFDLAQLRIPSNLGSIGPGSTGLNITNVSSTGGLEEFSAELAIAINEAFGGHVAERHIDKSDDYLIARAQKVGFASTFRSAVAANKVINRAYEVANPVAMALLAAGKIPSVRVDLKNPTPTGYGFAADGTRLDVYNATVIFKLNNLGFIMVLTAYPNNIIGNSNQNVDLGGL
ncbi:RHS repeat-associated core domain-containing protein [Phenylobacterium sp.]|uniref:RHS repeat-associated core domain-containing protein n=1 Tax=Phenylobacterium sp. TaxID=1871053 RepID=UPI0030F3DA9B